jgi:hypothetical protein
LIFFPSSAVDVSVPFLLLFLQDIDYIRKYYTMEFDDEQAVHTLGGRDESERIKLGKESFKPFVFLLFLPFPLLIISSLVALTSRS